MYTVATDLDQIFSWAIFEFVFTHSAKKKKKKWLCTFFYSSIFQGHFYVFIIE